jgi:hypothetical protein
MKIAYKYRLLENITMFEKLYIKGDKVYIEKPDEEGFAKSSVFNEDKTYVGALIPSYFSEILPYLEKLP